MLSRCIFVILMMLFFHNLYGQQSSLVKRNPDGTLTYIPEANGNTIPDFSAVGYRRSDADLPNIPVVKTINAAVSGSSRQIIQDAVDEVSAMPLQPNGFRGAILCKKGTYYIEDSIKVSVSGIVIRGEGENSNGTKWIAAGKGQRALLHFIGQGSRSNLTATRSDITDTFVSVGTFSFNVASTAGYAVGDEIVVVRPGTDKWIQDLKMDVIENVSSANEQWRASQYYLYFERQITKIEGNRIYVDNPMVQQLEQQYGGGYICKYSFAGRIQDVGVEYIQFESEYASNTDEDHGWIAVEFTAVQHGFARNIVSRYFGYSTVTISGNSKYVTVKDCKGLDAKSRIEGARRYTFNIGGRAQLNLITGCYAREGRHDFVTGARTGGPNVFHNSSSDNAYSDVGPHQRWAIGTLYDNITTEAIINIQDRGAAGGNGHGWTGVTQVLWNCTSTNRISVQSPWVSGKNYAIAVQGIKYSGSYFTNRPDGEWQLRNSSVTPSSLFEAQLAARRKTLQVNADLFSFVGELQNGQIVIKWASTNEQNVNAFELKHSTNNVTYSTIQTLSANNNNAGNGYTFTHSNIATGANYYKLVVKNATEQIELPYLITVNGIALASDILFKQEFEQGSHPNDFIRPANAGKGFFEALGTTTGTTDDQATFNIANGKAVLGKIITGAARGYSYLVKRNFNPDNAELLCFKLAAHLNYVGGSSNSIFQILFGKNFTENGLPDTEDNDKLFTRVTFNGFGGSTQSRFRVRANASLDASTIHDGMQTITIFINTSSETKKYLGPDNQQHDLPLKNYNVWVGSLKQKFGASLNENIAASNQSTVPLQDFKILLTGGQPSTLEIDNIEVSALPTVLPVTLVSFTAAAKQNGVQLQWQTSSEQANSHFNLMRSANGKDFYKIGTKIGLGYSSVFNNYYFTDAKPLIGTSYYKLLQVDLDGTTKEYKPIVVNYQLNKQPLLAFLSSDKNLNIVFNTSKSCKANLLITDILGRSVYSQIVYFEQGANQKSIAPNILFKGMNIISVQMSDETREVYQTKFINQ